MSLTDLLEPPPRNPGGLPCRVGALLSSLDDGDRKVLEQALADRRWSNPTLAARLIEKGHDVNRDAVSKHRRQQCRCF